MDKFKYQFIALLIAATLGFFIGSYVNKQNKYKTEKDKLRKQIDSTLLVIKIKNKIILKQDSLIKLDSISIKNLMFDIKQDGVVVKKEQQEIQKLKPNEKVTWLYNYFNIK